MEKKAKIIWGVVLSIVLLAGGGLAAWAELSWLAEKKERLKAEKAKTKGMQAKANKVPELRDKEKDLKAKSEVERLKIPDFTADEFDNFVDNIEKMRRRSNTYIGAAKVAKQQRAARGAKALPKTIKKITYRLDMGGAFYSLVRFLNLVETQTRHIKIETCLLTSSQAAERTPVDREMTVYLSTFAYDLPSDQKAADKKQPEEGEEEKPEEKPVVETTPIPVS